VAAMGEADASLLRWVAAARRRGTTLSGMGQARRGVRMATFMGAAVALTSRRDGARAGAQRWPMDRPWL
jgi:hypothetical protein